MSTKFEERIARIQASDIPPEEKERTIAMATLNEETRIASLKPFTHPDSKSNYWPSQNAIDSYFEPDDSFDPS